MKPTLALICLLALCAQTAHGQTLIAHHGTTNPQLEGWNRSGSGFPQPTGAAVFDGSVGAWKVDKAIANSSLLYSYTINAASLLAAKQKGWSFAFSLLVAEYPSPADNSIFFQIDTNGEVWNGRIGATANGEPIFQFGYGSYPAYTLSSGAGEYHDYDLVYNPLEGNLDLYIDDALQLANIEGGSSGNSLGTGGVTWGASGFSGTGSGHWNSVEFSIIPEPASVGICTGAAVIILCLFRNKIRRRM